jgi:hypothetical protein
VTFMIIVYEVAIRISGIFEIKKPARVNLYSSPFSNFCPSACKLEKNRTLNFNHFGPSH